MFSSKKIKAFEIFKNSIENIKNEDVVKMAEEILSDTNKEALRILREMIK